MSETAVSDPKTVGIVGVGYVGLPLAVAAANAGHRVIGFDTNRDVVAQLNEAHSHVSDVSDEELLQALNSSFEFTVDMTRLGEADVVVVCVPTPLSGDGLPDLGAVRAVAEALSTTLKSGALVVLESTTYPGTTEDLFGPIIESSGMERGIDFHLAFSPERVDPGNKRFGIVNTPKVVGGASVRATELAADFYGSFIETVVKAKGTREAEMAKLLENTYRHINIALVNEMAKFSHELGIDLWDVIRCASTKPFGFQAFYPGPGVGGHCIPIDPNYLSHTVRSELGYPFRFVELAQEINTSMPRYVAERVQEILNGRDKSVRGSTVLLLGVTYKANLADERESPAVPIASRLMSLGAHVIFHDPYILNWSVTSGSSSVRLSREDDVLRSAAEADVTVLLQAHDEYLTGWLDDLPVLDTRGVLIGSKIDRL